MRERTLPRYYSEDFRKEFLELHDNHTWWEIEVENDIDISEEYEWKVEEAIEVFERHTGVKIYLLGRSGRHCCVEDTPENSRRYQYLEKKALKLEQKVIDYFNKRP